MKHIFSVFSIACVAFFTIFLSTTNVSCKKGDTGPKGDTGVANSVYSAWLDVTYTNQGDTFFYTSIPAPKLTADFINQGSVHVYMNVGTVAAPEIVSLPYAGFYIIPYIGVGKIDLEAIDDFSTFGTGTAKRLQYRWIAVGGTVPARSALNWNDYKAVAAYYGIKD